MDLPTSPSPRPENFQPPLPLPLPSLTANLGEPLPQFQRPSSASATHRNASSGEKRHVVRAVRRRQTRSAPSSRSTTASESDFSMAQYTIDLEKLGEKASGLTMDALEETIEPVGSEGEGPKDFTINMEKWMRGAEKWRKAGGQEGMENGDGEDENRDHSEGEMGNEHPQHEEGIREESEFVPLSTSTPATFGKRKIGEGELKLPEKEINQPPLPSRLNSEMMQNQVAEEVFDQISALQAEVERLRVEFENNAETLVDYIQHLQAEIDEIKADQGKAKIKAGHLQEGLKLCEDARTLDRISSDDAASRVGLLDSKFDLVLQELAIARSTAESEKLAAETKISTLDAKVQKLQTDNAKQQTEVQKIQQAKAVEFQDLKSELDACKGEIKAYQQALQSREEDRPVPMANLNQTTAAHNPESNTTVLKLELGHANEQLAESRQAVETVEDENDRLTQENERQRMENRELISDIEKKNALINAAESKANDLTEEIDHIEAEKNAGSVAESVREAEIDALQQNHLAEIDDLRQRHLAEIDDLRQHHEACINGLECALDRLLKDSQKALRRTEYRLQSSHKGEIAALKEQITTLEARLKSSTEPTSSTSTLSLRNTNDLLSTANQNLSTARQALTSTKASLAKAQRRIEKMQERQQQQQPPPPKDGKGSLDEKEKWATVLRERDVVWTRKMNALLEERETMAHELMLAWGREEMGPANEGEKQLYRYKYVRRGKVEAV